MFSAGIIPDGLSDVAFVVLLVVFLVSRFTSSKKSSRVESKVEAVSEKLTEHARVQAKAHEVRADRVIETMMSTTGKTMEPCPGYKNCRERYRHKAIVTDMYQLTGVNRVAIELSACVTQLLVAENGEGPPKIGQRAYTTVVKQIALEGNPLRPWVYLHVSPGYVQQVLQPLLVRSVLEVTTSELTDMNTSDVLTTSDPPIHSMAYYLLDVRTSGIWFLAVYFKEDTPPKLTEETRQVIRESATVITQTLPGTVLDTGFYGVGSGLCKWGTVD